MENNEMIFLREVNSKDCKQLFEWANDVNVRNNAFNQAIIDWEGHVKWFNNKLESKDSEIFILTNSNNQNLGQIRIDFEKKSKRWVIDYSIDKNFRGNGYGIRIIELITQKYSDKKFKAIVKEENIASCKVFKRIKFQEIFDEKNKTFQYTFN